MPKGIYNRKAKRKYVRKVDVNKTPTITDLIAMRDAAKIKYNETHLSNADAKSLYDNLAAAVNNQQTVDTYTKYVENNLAAIAKLTA